jgi:hypothetical protein
MYRHVIRPGDQENTVCFTNPQDYEMKDVMNLQFLGM